MKIYKAVFKERDRESYWNNKSLLIVAANYANAEDKAKNFRPDREILSLSLSGDTTNKPDVFELCDR